MSSSLEFHEDCSKTSAEFVSMKRVFMTVEDVCSVSVVSRY